MLQHTEKRIIVSVDTESKNSYRFGNGQILVTFPNTNNLDRRFSAPVNGIVVSADDIPIGAEVLVEHNSAHITNEIFEYKNDNPDIKYFSVPELEVFVWRKVIAESVTVSKDKEDVWSKYMGEWHPTKYYAIGERVYEPYKGVFHGIKPTRIKNTLLIKTGQLKDKIVHIIKNGEYEIIYQDTNGQPNQILVTFHVEDENELSDLVLNAKQEILCVNEALTERWLNGELLTGLTDENCKPIKEKLAYAD